jgi:hypothetical protein
MMKKIDHAKRLRAKLYRYLALLNITLPIEQMDAIEKIILEELQEFETQGAFFGREEDNGKTD